MTAEAAASSPGPRGLLERRERRIEIRPDRRLRRGDRGVVVSAVFVAVAVVVVVVIVVRLALLQWVTATVPGRRHVGRRRGRRPLAHYGVDAEPGGRLFDRQPTAAGHYGGRVRRLYQIAVLVRHQRRLRQLLRFVRRGRSSGRCGGGHLPVVQQIQTERYARQLGGR